MENNETTQEFSIWLCEHFSFEKQHINLNYKREGFFYEKGRNPEMAYKVGEYWSAEEIINKFNHYNNSLLKTKD